MFTLRSRPEWIFPGWLLLMCLPGFFAGCADQTTASVGPASAPTKTVGNQKPEPEIIVPAASEATHVERDPLRPEFATRLLEIAQAYESFSVVDSHLRWADAACAPPLQAETTLQESSNPDVATHGKKLYALYAKELFRRAKSGNYEHPNYVRSGEPIPVGQIVVKEAWVPEVDDPAGPKWVRKRYRPARRSADREVGVDGLLPAKDHQGRLYYPKEKSTLFVMYKLPPETPDTDEGWVYGMVAGDGKAVLAAGRIVSCMNCHREAPYERFFGIPIPNE